jgi:myxalamid-type polyketide synthase MxaB
MSPDRETIEYRSLLTDALAELRDLRSELEAREEVEREPIAIVGMGCRFPGSARTPQLFWRLLLERRDAITEVPKSRWNIDDYYDSNRDRLGKMYTRTGGFLDEVDQFDASFFGISPREAKELDPQHRLLLEVTWEALEHAGNLPTDVAGKKTGVFVGLFMGDYAQLGFNSGNPAAISGHNCTGNLRSMAAGRIAYHFGFHGPALQLDTACSSSLYAIHLACQSLRLRECNRALAGGVNLMLTPDATIGVCRLGALSEDGRCKTFSGDADGYGRGEGCGVVVLKRLSDARRDNDRVLALIRGSAANHDGRSNGLTAPNGVAQEAVIRDAMANAGVEPHRIQYVETHGTGTLLGDPIEALALGAVLGEGRHADQRLAIGSVKTNFGHLESAAGIAAFIKTTLALSHRLIPPNLHFTDPNPHIPWNSLPLIVPTKPMMWPAVDGSRLAGVSAFGMSGTNVHVVLEEAPEVAAVVNELERPRHVLCLSARSEKALGNLAASYEEYLANGSQSTLADICFTASVGRKHFNHRAAIEAGSTGELLERLRGYRAGNETAGVATGVVSSASEPKIAFLFTGQGSQYAGMGRQLYETQPVFRENLEKCQTLLGPWLELPLLSVIFAEDEQTAALLDETEYTQPALFVLEYSLARMWQSWGVEPAVLLGHSVGEYVAACIGGIFTVEDGLRLIAARGRLMQRLPRDGAMATVFADGTRVRKAIEGYSSEVGIAAINGPTNTVISGRTAVVEEICRKLNDTKVRTKPLKVSHAFHSPLMAPMIAEFEAEAGKVKWQMPEKAIISNLTGELGGAEMTRPEYWCRQVREAVRFGEGARRLVSEGVKGCLEIGPKPALTRMASETEEVSRSGMEMWGSVDGRREDWEVVLETVGRMYAKGVAIDWEGYDRGYARRRVELPGYPFERQRYWVEGERGGWEGRSVRAEAVEHELAGWRVREAWTEETRYEGELSTESPEYLRDHRVYGEAVVPAAAYLEMMQWATWRVVKGEEVELEGTSFRQAMVLKEGERKRVQVVVKPEGGEYGLRVYSEEEGRWVLHASGKGRRAEGGEREPGEGESLEEVRGRCVERVDAEEMYEMYRGRGLEYGEGFRPVKEVWRGEGEAVALLEMPERVKGEAGYRLHPVMLDGSLQTLGAVFGGKEQGGGETYLPVGMKRLRVVGASERTLWCHARTSNVTSADLTLFRSDGSVVAIAEGLELLPATREKLLKDPKDRANDLHANEWKIEWTPRELRGTDERRITKRLWIVLSDSGGVGQQLTTRLRSNGDDVWTVHPGKGFSRTAANEITINPSSPADGDALMRVAAETLIPLRGLINLWALDEETPDFNASALTETSPGSCATLLNLTQVLARATQGPRLWVVTRQSQFVMRGDGLEGLVQSMLWGMGQVVAAELPKARCSLIDLDGRNPRAEADAIFSEIWNGDDEQLVAYREGERWVRSIRQIDAPPNHLDQLSIPKDTNYALESGPGSELAALRLSSVPRRAPGVGEIELEVRAAGLNFRDVLNAMGLYPGDPGALGGECSGVVVSVGSGIDSFAAGDEVVVMSPGSCRKYLTVDVSCVARKPSGLSFEGAATIPVAFLTAYHALLNIAKLSRGDRVLIHSASGGVGMAAIQIARLVGAEIHATASPGKWDALRSHGITHIYNSRTLEFADQILEATEGRGVEVVLNSLNGEFIEEGLRVLSRNGRFVEIGKRGVWSHEQVARVRPDAEYFLCDLVEETARDRDLFATLFGAVSSKFAAGLLKPLRVTTFPIEQATASFRLMQQARHMGKIALSFPADPHMPLTFSSEKTYLITGGLGGLGLDVARWLVEHGARHLALVSRSDPQSAQAERISKLKQMGATVRVCKADLASGVAVERMLAEISTEMPPLRGIFHAAGVLDDGVLQKQNWERFSRVIAPKSAGAWHLHRMTLEHGLDLFVLFSSIASVSGSSGQANYAAANAFLDALAHYRRRRGLPALSINWGPWAEVGMAAKRDQRQLARSETRGVLPLAPDAALQSLGQVLRERSAQVVVARLNSSSELLEPRDTVTRHESSFADQLHRLPAAGQAIGVGGVFADSGCEGAWREDGGSDSVA